MNPIGERKSAIILLAAFSAALLIHAWAFDYVVDDAFISFRYARNWLEGDGLVFNPGERVEGYTNFLWTVLLAAGMRAAIDPILFAKVAGSLAGILLLWALFSFGRRRLPTHSLAFLLPIPLVASGAFALWCTAGLETALFTLLLFTGAAAAVSGEGRRGFVLPSLLLALATLTRPEGALIYAVVLGDRLFSRRGRPADLLPGVILFLLLAGGHEAWRISYYGDLLPNTYYAKTGGGVHAAARGLRYVARFFGPFGGWTVAAPLPLLFLGGLRRWERTFLLLAAAQIAYVVVIGGDSLPYYRFLVPPLPFLALLAVAALDRLFSFREGSLSGLRVAAFAVLFALPLHASFRGEERRFLDQDRRRIELHWKVIGRYLAEHADRSASIAVTTAGAIPYYSGLPTIDMLGITDRTIARRKMPHMGEGLAGHEKHDMAYVLSRRPTYILHYPFLLPEPIFSVSQFRTPWNRGLADLLESERFDREYRGESVSIGPMHLVYFRRREDADR